jgi:hypothetical protein
MLSVIEAKISGVLLPGQPSDEIRASHLAKHTPQAVTKKYLEVCIQASNKQ